MSIQSYNDFITRIGTNFWANEPICEQLATSSVLSSGSIGFVKLGATKTVPNPLPTGVTAYIPTEVSLASTAGGVAVVAKVINLGSLNMGTNVFTDGSPMPTATVLGVSTQLASPVLFTCTTAFNATPGNFTITYTNQAGTTSITSASFAAGNSQPVNGGGWFSLNAGDWGVQDLTGATQSGGTAPSGVVKFWGLIPIAMFPIGPVGSGNTTENMLTSAFNLVRLGAGDQVACFSFNLTNARSIVGQIFYVGDN